MTLTKLLPRLPEKVLFLGQNRTIRFWQEYEFITSHIYCFCWEFGSGEKDASFMRMRTMKINKSIRTSGVRCWVLVRNKYGCWACVVLLFIRSKCRVTGFNNFLGVLWLTRKWCRVVAPAPLQIKVELHLGVGWWCRPRSFLESQDVRRSWGHWLFSWLRWKIPAGDFLTSNVGGKLSACDAAVVLMLFFQGAARRSFPAHSLDVEATECVNCGFKI